MIIVTGTKRSGTSMWMQILRGAGFAIVGEAFPRDWANTIREGNPLGFYESPLRRGIHLATNPDPCTGAYLCPTATRSVVVKVFVPGLLRTDLRFVHKVIATMRPFREYMASVERLYRMEHENRRAQRSAPTLPAAAITATRPMVAPVLAWWSENYGLLRDAALRRYPLHLVSYGRVLSEPAPRVRAALQFLGAGDEARARAQVRCDLQTQHGGRAEGPLFDAEAEAVFDELYARVHDGVRLDQAFFSRLDRTHARLMPRLQAEHARVSALRRTRQPRAPASSSSPTRPRPPASTNSARR